MALPYLLVYGGGSEGGAVEYLHHLMANVDRTQFQPVFLSMGRDALKPMVQSLEVEYRTARSPLAIAAIARQSGARFLHTHGVRANFAGRLAGLLSGRPSVTTVHSMIGMDYVGAPRRVAATFLDNLTLPLASRVIAISGAIAQEVVRRGARRERVRVVHIGIPPAPPADRAAIRAELGLAEATRALFAAARLHPVKGLDRLLAAVARLEPDLPPWQLLIAGDGPLRAPLEAQATALGLGGRVRFLGQVPQARRLLAGMDLYISASLMEGLGLSVMEAMAAGLPVLSTAAGGVTELLAAEQTGLLVPVDDVPAMAAAIRRLLTDPDLGRRLAAGALAQYTEHFTVEQFVRRTEAVYREMGN